MLILITEKMLLRMPFTDILFKRVKRFMDCLRVLIDVNDNIS